MTYSVQKIKIYDSGVITTDGSGAATHNTTLISGEILKIIWDYVDTTGTADPTITTQTPITELIDTATNFAADVVHYPVVLTQIAAGTDTTAEYARRVVNDVLTISMTAGGATKTFRVYIYYY